MHEVTSKNKDSAGGQIRGMELSFPLPDFWGGGQGLRLKKSPLANDLVNDLVKLSNEASIKPQSRALWSIFGELPCAHLLGHRLREDRGSFVLALALCS